MVMKPMIHVNGTSREHLLAQLEGAADGCRILGARLREAAPHGRDYYPQGDTAYLAALKEHLDRVAKVESIYKEICEIWEAVSNGG